MTRFHDRNSAFPPLAFVDLETTGATAARDRITEIGVVCVDGDGVSEWHSLLDPECGIPQFIQCLTGIDQETVAGAPRFGAIAGQLAELLHGRLLVAHNARFDYAFLRQEFQRAGVDFRVRTLCTVRLSRQLYPEHTGHSLDALAARHGLAVGARHRALDDARLLWQFWQHARRTQGEEVLTAAVAALCARPSWPAHLDPALADELPEGPGVYIFYGENSLPIYIGKSVTLRRRVLSHFAGDHASSKEMSLSMQVRRIEWQETAGELGALLVESALVKRLLPTHNRQLRRQAELCTWRLDVGPQGLQPCLVGAAALEPGRQDALYGLFRSRREAQETLRSLAEAQGLCFGRLGLEKLARGRPCFRHQIGKCRGACAGRETTAAHDERLLAGLREMQLRNWPYAGPVALHEGDERHVIDAWRYLGSARDAAGVRALLAGGRPAFDADTYKLLLRHLREAPAASIEPLDRAADAGAQPGRNVFPLDPPRRTRQRHPKRKAA